MRYTAVLIGEESIIHETGTNLQQVAACAFKRFLDIADIPYDEGIVEALTVVTVLDEKLEMQFGLDSPPSGDGMLALCCAESPVGIIERQSDS